MSVFTYTIETAANGDVSPIRHDGQNTPVLQQSGIALPVKWSDPDFQSWNAAQPTPAVLSAAQQAIQSAKAMTFAQFQTWWTGATAAQQQRVIYELLQRALRSEIV